MRNRVNAPHTAGWSRTSTIYGQMASQQPDHSHRPHVACSALRRVRMALPETAPRRRRFGSRDVLRRLVAPIRDDDLAFPWRPVAVLFVAIVFLVATVITLSFLVAWLVTGQAY
jgi:hypothetical protein